ncbi:hypothetical protein KKB18_01475 [bacterium]|nr:hypothetical protein [bacterium]
MSQNVAKFPKQNEAARQDWDISRKIRDFEGILMSISVTLWDKYETSEVRDGTDKI